MKSIIVLFFLIGIQAFAGTQGPMPLMATTSGVVSSSVEVLAADTYGSRRCLRIQNKGGQTIFVKYDSAHSSDEGLHIGAGETLTWECGSAPKNSIYLKASTATQAYVIEYSK